MIYARISGWGIDPMTDAPWMKRASWWPMPAVWCQSAADVRNFTVKENV